jgi:hypothetical protein
MCGPAVQAVLSFSLFSGNCNDALSTWPEDVAPLAYRKRPTAARASGFDGDMMSCVDAYCTIA